MPRIERTEPSGPFRLTATGATPVELMQDGLTGVLAIARQGQAEGTPADAGAVPVRGLGADLSWLFLALCQDLLSQLDTFGTGFDQVRLDGLLRTDTGGYTAWGYLSGDPDTPGLPPALTISRPNIRETPEALTLRCEVHFG